MTTATKKLTKNPASAPVIPDMEDGKYRARPEISNSDLGLVLDSPKAFAGVKAGELEGFSSSGFRMGSALDCLILTPDIWDDTYLLEPFDMVKPSSAQETGFCSMVLSGSKESDAIIELYVTKNKTEEAIAKMAFEKIDKFETYMDHQRLILGGKLGYDQKDYEELMLMKAAILDHEIAGPALIDGVNGFVAFSQLAIFWSMMGIDCKALLDRCLIDKKNKIIRFYDLKFSGKSIGFFENSIRQYRYYRQLSYYWEGLQIIFPKFEVQGRIVAATPKWGGECRVLDLEMRWIEEGLKEIEELITRYVWHKKNNKFGFRRAYYENNGIEVVPYVK